MSNHVELWTVAVCHKRLYTESMEKDEDEKGWTWRGGEENDYRAGEQLSN